MILLILKNPVKQEKILDFKKCPYITFVSSSIEKFSISKSLIPDTNLDKDYLKSVYSKPLRLSKKLVFLLRRSTHNALGIGLLRLLLKELKYLQHIFTAKASRQFCLCERFSVKTLGIGRIGVAAKKEQDSVKYYSYEEITRRQHHELQRLTALYYWVLIGNKCVPLFTANIDHTKTVLLFFAHENPGEKVMLLNPRLRG